MCLPFALLDLVWNRVSTVMWPKYCSRTLWIRWVRWQNGQYRHCRTHLHSMPTERLLKMDNPPQRKSGRFSEQRECFSGKSSSKFGVGSEIFCLLETWNESDTFALDQSKNQALKPFQNGLKDWNENLATVCVTNRHKVSLPLTKSSVRMSFGLTPNGCFLWNKVLREKLPGY